MSPAARRGGEGGRYADHPGWIRFAAVSVGGGDPICGLPLYPKKAVAPGLAAAVLALLIAAGRWNLWASEQVSPLTQVLFFPGLPALALLAGLFAGWRFWKWFWRPRVVDGR